MNLTDGERVAYRDDLDGLEDDQTQVEDPDLRRAKTLLFALAFLFLSAITIVLVVFFQPEGVVMTESWPNGYRRTRTTYVSAPAPEGRVAHGAYSAWHQNGRRAVQGRFEQGRRVGAWRFWDEAGVLDAERSGIFVQGARVSPLED